MRGAEDGWGCGNGRQIAAPTEEVEGAGKVGGILRLAYGSLRMTK